MRRPSPILVIGSLLAASPARADRATYHATASGNVAVTDSISTTGDTSNQTDVFYELRPGLLFSYDARRVMTELTGEADIIGGLQQTTPSLNVRVGWQSVILPGPRSELSLGANGSTNQLHALWASTSPDQTAIGALPVGRLDLRQADASEYLSWLASREMRVGQAAFARFTATTDNAVPLTTTESWETGGGLSLERTFQHDSIGVEAGLSYLYFERISDLPPGPMGSRLDRQLNPRGSLVWRHDINQSWSANLDGGAVYVHPVGTDPYNPMDGTRGSAVYPVFGGLVAYTQPWGSATLTAHRAMAANMLLAQNTLSDSVTTQFAMPLPWLDPNPHRRNATLVGVGALGLERSQLVDPSTSELIGSFALARMDVALGWTPTPGQTYGIRYELVYQHGDAAATMVSPSFFRNTLFFTFAFRYPGRLGVRMPRRTQSVRADRKDLVGPEPVIPDPTEQLPTE